MLAPQAMGIGIISAGKVGAAIGNALRAAGHQIVGAYATSPDSIDRLETMLPGVPALDIPTIVERSELVLLAVPDDQLSPLVAGLAKLGAWQPGQIVVHTAGCYGTGVLAPAAAAGAMCLAIHPAMTFTGTSLDVARLAGCPFAVTAPKTIQAIGLALVAQLGGEGYLVSEADRSLYHAALSHGANHVVTVLGQARQALQAAGISEPGEYLRPLIQAAVEGALSSGEALLTGPVSRADIGTVTAHVNALDTLRQDVPADADLFETYCYLAGVTAERAVRRRVITSQDAAEIHEALRGDLA